MGLCRKRERARPDCSGRTHVSRGGIAPRALFEIPEGPSGESKRRKGRGDGGEESGRGRWGWNTNNVQTDVRSSSRSGREIETK